MKHKLSCLAAAAVLAGPAVAQQLPGPDDYAYGFPLLVTDEREYFTADVPLELYRSVSDPALRDAGVYNAAGQPVPRIFERPDHADDAKEHAVELGLVPLHGPESGQADHLRVLLRRDGASTTLELDTEETPAPETPGPLTAYIADLREIADPLEALEFRWPPQASGFIGRLRAEGSDDLQRWRVLGTATVADLEHGDTRIEQNRLELSGSWPDYLRITWQKMPPGFRLDGVRGVRTGTGAPVGRDRMTLLPADRDEAGREYRFDAAAFPPVDRVRLLFPDDNVVVRAGIYHRSHPEERWHLAHQGLFYDLARQGIEVQSPAASIAVARSSQWLVKLESGATGAKLRLELEWRPDRLLFLAQGPAPFELVAGRAHDRLERFPQDSMLGDAAIFHMLKEAGSPGNASIGRRQERAGPTRLEIAPRQSWRVAALWAGLVAAVLLVAWLVWSLMREMRE